MGDGEWVDADGWCRVLRQGPDQWSASVVYAIVANVGAFRLELELRDDEGLSYDEVATMIEEAEGVENARHTESVAVTTGQEQLVADALRAHAARSRTDGDGESWTVPDRMPSWSSVAPGPPLHGVELEAYKLVKIAPELAEKTKAQLQRSVLSVEMC